MALIKLSKFFALGKEKQVALLSTEEEELKTTVKLCEVQLDIANLNGNPNDIITAEKNLEKAYVDEQAKVKVEISYLENKLPSADLSVTDYFKLKHELAKKIKRSSLIDNKLNKLNETKMPTLEEAKEGVKSLETEISKLESILLNENNLIKKASIEFRIQGLKNAILDYMQIIEIYNSFGYEILENVEGQTK